MQLLTALQKRGYEFRVITSHDNYNLPDEGQFRGISIYRFPFQSVLLRYDMSLLKTIQKRVAEIKRRFRPHVIHINSIQPSVFFHLLTHPANTTSVLVTVHSPLRRFKRNSMVSKLLHTAHWVTTVSKAMLSDVLQFMPEMTARTSVVYNGLDMPALQPAPLPFDEPRIMCLGRVVADKGFDLALCAFRRTVDRFPKARFIIAGDGPERAPLERQAAKLGLAQAVEFTGWIRPEDIPQLINTVTMVLMPSRWREPFGLVAVQAAQMARPIVASRVGGLPEIVVHGETGILVEKENSAALAEQIAFLLQHPEQAIQMGQAARKRSQDLFGMERFAGDYDALYQKLITTEFRNKGPSQ